MVLRFIFIRSWMDYELIGLKSAINPVKQKAPWGHQVKGPRAEQWRIEGEQPIIELIQSIAPKETCIDVGSWIGKYALLMSKTAMHVIAIEPDKRNYRFLKQNIALNYAANIEPIQAAVDIQEAHTILRVSSSAAGTFTARFKISIWLQSQNNIT